MSLADQFLLILQAATLLLALTWICVAVNRRTLLRRLKTEEEQLFQKLTGPNDAEGTASRAEMLEKAASDPKLSRTFEFKKWNRTANKLPVWLRTSEPERYFFPTDERYFAPTELLQIGRGSLLVATLGGAITCSGVFLAKSDFQLLSLLGIAVAVLGLQVMYAAATFGSPQRPHP